MNANRTIILYIIIITITTTTIIIIIITGSGRELIIIRGNCSETVDNLLIDPMVCEDAQRRKRNLSMAWIDVAKAHDSVDHG